MTDQNDVPEGNVSNVLGWVNEPDDLDERKERAQAALDKETGDGGEGRSTLKASLRQILDSDSSEQADEANRQPAGAGQESDQDGNETEDNDVATDPTQAQAPGTVDPDQVLTTEEYEQQAESTDADGGGEGTTTPSPVYVQKDGQLHQVAQIRTR